MTPIFLSNRTPWFGNHTGYQQWPRYMQKLTPLTKVSVANIASGIVSSAKPAHSIAAEALAT